MVMGTPFHFQPTTLTHCGPIQQTYHTVPVPKVPLQEKYHIFLADLTLTEPCDTLKVRA